MSGQAERLDQIVWSYGLRGELPENIHSEGLRIYNLAGNCLERKMVKDLESQLKHNSYLRVLLL